MPPEKDVRLVLADLDLLVLHLGEVERVPEGRAVLVRGGVELEVDVVFARALTDAFLLLELEKIGLVVDHDADLLAGVDGGLLDGAEGCRLERATRDVEPRVVVAVVLAREHGLLCFLGPEEVLEAGELLPEAEVAVVEDRHDALLEALWNLDSVVSGVLLPEGSDCLDRDLVRRDLRELRVDVGDEVVLDVRVVHQIRVRVDDVDGSRGLA